MSDHDRISPYNINTVQAEKEWEWRELSIRWLSVDPVTNSLNENHDTVQQSERRITDEILGMKGLTL